MQAGRELTQAKTDCDHCQRKKALLHEIVQLQDDKKDQALYAQQIKQCTKELEEFDRQIERLEMPLEQYMYVTDNR